MFVNGSNVPPDLSIESLALSIPSQGATDCWGQVSRVSYLSRRLIDVKHSLGTWRMCSLFGRTYLNRCRLVRGELFNHTTSVSSSPLAYWFSALVKTQVSPAMWQSNISFFCFWSFSFLVLRAPCFCAVGNSPSRWGRSECGKNSSITCDHEESQNTWRARYKPVSTQPWHPDVNLSRQNQTLRRTWIQT